MKIAVFICDVYQTYQIEVTRAIGNFAKKHNLTVHIFANFVAPSNTVFHVQGARSIINLPDLSNYDGILLAGDTFKLFGMQGELMKRIRNEAKCPVVSLRELEERYTSVIVDNTKAMYDMTNHFIKDHGFTDICFVTGRMEMRDAQERLKGYELAMIDADIPVVDSMIYYGNYWINKGREIVEAFIDNRGHMPQAIICSNDHMAISVCNELKKRGIKIPEEICVSGVDDLPEVQVYNPQITSIEMPIEDMTEAALTALVKLINGEELASAEIRVETKQHYHESCGCNDDKRFNLASMFDNLSMSREIARYSVYMTTDYDDALNERECIEHIGRMSKDYDFKKFFVCLCEAEATDEDGHKIHAEKPYTDTMYLKHYYAENGESVYSENTRFECKNLLPQKFLTEIEGEVSYVVPVHLRNEIYGYVVFVLSDEIPCVLDARYEYLCLRIATLLHTIDIYEEMFEMRDIRELYLKDSLTNIYNRRGMQRGFDLIFKKSKSDWGIYIVSIDMDGLKYINDTFGHERGDDSIIKIAECIEESIVENEFCARIGGDEFIAVLIDDKKNRIETFLDSIRQRLKVVNASIDENYEVAVSIGYSKVLNQTNLMEAIREADMNMYIDKNKKYNRQSGRK